MNTKEIIVLASKHLNTLPGYVFDLLTIEKPKNQDSAVNLSKVISKLSPILGNMIEFNTVDFLNSIEEFQKLGSWKRQEPGFPDAIFKSNINPTPGLEIKAWFPLATEITARFKDSQNVFVQDNTYVALLAWLPEFILFGKPKIVSVCIVSGKSVAKARDKHYHNPPDYFVIEPEDTASRTLNLQQSNTSGYKWQSEQNELMFKKAEKIVNSWGDSAKKYSLSSNYQDKLRKLMGNFKYRLDTNFSKLDRIGHTDIEKFKQSTLNQNILGLKIGNWAKLFNSKNDEAIKKAIAEKLEITG